MNTGELKTTCLSDRHIALNARMAPFGGYLMPIQYTGILAEHEAVRRHVGIFDTCHMGEFRLSGPTAETDLEHLVTCHVDTLRPGRCRYGMLCNPDGGVIDDLLVYRLDDRTFMLVVNAGTAENDFDWIQSHLSPETRAENLTDETAKVDIQGPASPPIVRSLLEQPIDEMVFYSFRENRFDGETVLVSRTGYTGEMGFEIYGSPDAIRKIWDRCLDAGVTPAGLGARDTLRLEMGMPLYGHELRADRNAAESGFDRAIARDKSFIGSDVVLDPNRTRQRLVGILFEGRRAARAGETIQTPDGRNIGTITSGSFAPSLGRAVALAYLDKDFARPDTRVSVPGTRRPLDGVTTPLPFYPNGTARKPLHEFLK